MILKLYRKGKADDDLLFARCCVSLYLLGGSRFSGNTAAVTAVAAVVV